MAIFLKIALDWQDICESERSHIQWGVNYGEKRLRY